MKKLLCTILMVAMLMSLVACGSKNDKTTKNEAQTAGTTEAAKPDKKYTLKFGFQAAETAPEGIACQKFADAVAEKTNGGIEILCYPSEQLGTPMVMFEGASMGTLDITLVPCNQLTAHNIFFTCGSIPFLFPDNSTYLNALAGGIAESEEKTLDDNNLVLINKARNFYRGPYRVMVSTKPLRTLEDFKGLRMRAFENKIYMACWQKLGANPLVIPWNETYMALMQGTVEAAAGSLGEIPSTNFCEVGKYVVEIKEYDSEVIFVINKDSFGKLPEEYQKILMECADEAGVTMKDETMKVVDRDFKDIIANGVEFISIDTQPFREVLKDYYYELEAEGYLPAGTVDICFK